MFSFFILQLPSQSMAEEYQLPCVILLARYVVVNIHMHDDVRDLHKHTQVIEFLHPVCGQCFSIVFISEVELVHYRLD